MEQVLYKLPDGWEWSEISKVVDLVTKGTTPTSVGFNFESSGINFVKVENIKNGEIDPTSVNSFISPEANIALKRSILCEGDILFSIAGTIGTVALVNSEVLPANTNQALAIIRGYEEHLLGRYLMHILRSSISSTLNNKKRGGALQNISLKDIKETAIPIPPLSEQKRIVEKLDALLTRIDITIEHLQESVKQADSLLSSALNTVFNPSESKVSSDSNYALPEGWCWMAVKDLSTKIQYGHTAKAADKGNAQFLRITDIQDNNIDWSGVPLVELSEKEIEKYALTENDLVFARSGATAGKSILIKEPPYNAIFASYLIRITPNSELIQPEYLELFFRSPAYWDIVKANAAGAAQPNINGTKLGEFKVPTPNLENQKRIVDEMSILLTRVNGLKNEFRNKTLFLESTKSSILDSAFKGEL